MKHHSKPPTPSAPPPVAAAAEGLRVIARRLLDKHGAEGVRYRDAAFLATMIDHDTPHLAVKAHRLLVEHVASFTLEAGIVDPELIPLLNGLHDFISGHFKEYYLFSQGRWVDWAHLQAQWREAAHA